MFYSEMFFSVPDRYIVQAIARYRPDLVKNLSLD